MLKYRIKNKTGKILTSTSSDCFKYIVFQYLLPRPMFPPVRRMSKIYILNKEDKIENLAWKYNLFNALTCWLGLPFGPIHMLEVNTTNLKGGSEVSEDILQYITLESIENGFVSLPLYKGAFSTIDKAIQVEFEKVFSTEGLAKQSRIGYVKFKRKHHFFIGLAYDKMYLNKALLSGFEKVFDSRSVFHFHNLDENHELSKKLETLGIVI